MLTVIAATAATAALAGGPAFGMAASPAAYDAALPHHNYTIRVTNLGTRAERVRAALTTATSSTGVNGVGCSLGRSPAWASLAGPAAFRLGPHRSRTVLIRVGSAPAGRSELVAAFVATRPHSRGAVVTSGGVGTALRFAQPGRTAHAGRPCAAVAAPRPPATSDAGLPLEAGGGAAALLLVAGFIVVRHRRRGRMTT